MGEEKTDPAPVPATSTQVDKISIRVPPFWPEKPALWFSQLEAQFQLNHITSDATMFWHVISQLENKYALEVEDIILTPPDRDKYITIKSELIKRLSTSQQQRIRQLLEYEEIGDRTPTQFLRHLRSLAGNTVQEEFLKTLWMNRLPTVMQAILTGQDGLTLNKIAELADKIRETNAGTHVASTSTVNPEIAALSEQIKILAKQMEEISHDRGRNYPANRQRSVSRGPRPTQRHDADPSDPSGQTTCWYHRKFGPLARQCRTPCNFHAGNGSKRH